NPRRLVGLMNPAAESAWLSDINPRIRPGGGARPPRHRLRLGPLEQGPCSGRRRLTCPRLGRMSNTCDRSARPPLGRRLFRWPPTSTPVPFCSCNQPYPPPVLQG